MRKYFLSVVLMILQFNSYSNGDLSIYGSCYTLGYVEDGLILLQQNGSLTVIDGGSAQMLDGYDSTFEMQGGYVNNAQLSNCQVTVSGGEIEYLTVGGDTTIIDGYISSLHAIGTLNMTGGVIDTVNYGIYQGNEGTISGGIIEHAIAQQGVLWIYGGELSRATVEFHGDLHIVDMPFDSANSALFGKLYIHASDFIYDGLEVDYGTVITDALPWRDETCLLEYSLSDGSRVKADINLHDNGQLILVPEPATLAMLALGGMLIRRRRACCV